MELQPRNQGLNFNNSNSEDGISSFFESLNRKVLFAIGGIMLALLAVGLFVGGYYIGVGALKQASNNYKNRKDAVFQPIIDLPPVVWSGPCPKGALQCPSSFQGNYPLILISLDGFHPDYFKSRFTTTIKNIAKCGTDASYMYPVFPSKTFPNHYSQVTGVNPSSHGIIDNSMYDPDKKKVFKIGTPEAMKPYWWQKDPIWVTASKQGKNTGCFFWPGSDVKINDTLPTYTIKYDWKIPFESRVDKVLEWLDLPVSQRPEFITLYVNQPDHNAHKVGVNGKEIDEALEKVDKMIARLFSGLQQRDIVGCVNIIMISDHGMADIDCDRVVDIRSYIDVSDVYSTLGPYGKLRPKGRRNNTVIDNLIKQLSCKSKNMRVYAKEQLPVRMHFADNARIEPIFLDVDSGWTISSKGVSKGDSFCTGGSHGYDNWFPDMRAIFVGYGPSFKFNTTVKPFVTTELYELMAELIHIKGNPNNGTKGSMHHLLKAPQTLKQPPKPSSPFDALVPTDEVEYGYRVSAANCSCPQTAKQQDVNDVAGKKALHLPFGIPYSKEDNNLYNLLSHEDYISAFSLEFKLPMWTSFTVKGMETTPKLDDICWTGESRIHIVNTAKCCDYKLDLAAQQNIQQRPQFPPAFSSPSYEEEAKFVTNSVPKSLNHTKILEKKLVEVLGSWASQEGELNVVMGPAFDYDATGLKPSSDKILSNRRKNGHLLMPTHYYVIATWCLDKSATLKTCNTTQLESTSFLLPNHPFSRNCEPAAAVMTKNAARVVDIENLTGLKFFTEIPIYDAIRLRTAIPERFPN